MCDDTSRSAVNSMPMEQTPAPEQVVEQYRPMVLSMVRGLLSRSWQAGVEIEDLFQEANAALVELTREYDPERGTPFGAYLKQKLKWRLANFLRRELRRRNRTVGIDESMLEGLADATETLPSPEAQNPRLRAALRQLSPKQRSVLYEIYWREKTTNELALQLGVTPQNVTALRRRAEALIRRGMDE